MTEEKNYVYTKEELLSIFHPNEKINENFTFYSIITSKKPNIPVNKTNLFKININAVKNQIKIRKLILLLHIMQEKKNLKRNLIYQKNCKLKKM